MRHCRVLKNIWNYQKQTGSYVLKLTIHFSNIWIILIWIRTRNITAKKKTCFWLYLWQKLLHIYGQNNVSEQWCKSEKVYSFSSYSQRKPLLSIFHLSFGKYWCPCNHICVNVYTAFSFFSYYTCYFASWHGFKIRVHPICNMFRKAMLLEVTTWSNNILWQFIKYLTMCSITFQRDYLLIW